MNEQQNLETVQKGYEAFGRGDLEALLGLFDENIEWISPGPADFPLAGRRRGRAAVAEFFKTLNDVIDFQSFEPREFIAKGDRVIVLGTDTGRVKATGKVLQAEWAHTFRLQNGKVVGFQEYADMTDIVDELRTARSRSVA